MTQEINKPKLNVSRTIAIAVAGFAFGLISYAGCGGCSSKDDTKSVKPPEQLEQMVMQLAPDQKARVVHYIATNDQLSAEGAYSAGITFLESYNRRKDKR